MRNRWSLALASLLTAVALLAAGCGNASSGGTSAGGTPQQGGTLKLVGSSDVDHLDTASAYIGTVLVPSAFIVVANLLVNLGYALLDPRVRPP